ncbi:YihY/virulence factor BrkB family protein [Rurimicrobium arvi]|uniref:YihY/virulence factor BrkB family protein n=1 Tax=Rurimicrobium arvi TaxID=2049916 RepID=A0ABP8MWK2_9BACT
MNIKNLILKSAPAVKIKRWAQSKILPGFQGVSLYETGSFFVQNLNNVNLSDRCAAVTYNFLTALPPTLLFLFTLIPYLPLQNVQITILTTLKLMIPNDATYKGISKVLSDFLNKEQRSLLSFSLLLSLFYSSNGVIGLMRYFDKDHKVYVVRTALQRRWAAIKLTTMLIGVALASIVVFILQTETLNSWLEELFGSPLLIRASSLLLLFFIIFSAISCIYIYGPSLTHRFKFVSAGAVFATGMCIISSAIFFYAVNHFLNYNRVYGSIGTLIASFVWLSINTRIIMLGYDLNVSILMGRIHKTQKIQAPVVPDA